jgi:CO/xanthine dehydrogenase FAD-binding subunit
LEKFSYIRAGTAQEAVQLLNEPGLKNRALAGSTDMLLLLRYDPHYCDRLVDISLIPELRAIEERAGEVFIGAAATFSEVMESPLVRQTAPLLAQACHRVGAVQVRNMGTLGGNVINAAACADSLPALICLDAMAHILTPQGETSMPVSQLVVKPKQTLLPEGGLLTSLSYSIPPAGSRSAFLKLGRRNAMAISRLTVAALARQDDQGQVLEMRFATGSATPRIERLRAVEKSLLGEVPTPALLKSAAQTAVDEMIRLSGVRWSSEFKMPALRVMTGRVLAEVLDLQGAA